MQKAFTLIEMSVVIAIIGLVVGGIIAGQSYVRSAELTTTVNEARMYLTAMQQFERKYGGSIAGDMSNATSYWTGTYNGNGDGAVYYATANLAELFYVFQHLALAGQIVGTYTGLAGSASAWDGEPGSNLPQFNMKYVSGYFISPPSGGGFSSGDASLYDGNYGPYYLVVGRAQVDSLPQAGFLTAQEARELDSKFDNGLPNTGWIRSWKTSASCVSGTAYLNTVAADACFLLFSVP